MNESSVLCNRCVMDEATLRRTYRRIFRRNLLLFYLGSGSPASRPAARSPATRRAAPPPIPR